MDRRLAAFLCLSALLVAAYALVANKVDRAPRDEARFWIDKVNARPEYDVVLIGDSRVNRGIDPVTFGQALGGLEVLNFGFSGQGFTPAYLRAAAAKLSPTGKRTIAIGLTIRAFTPVALKAGGYESWSRLKPIEAWNARTFSDADRLLFAENPVLLAGRAVSTSAPRYTQWAEPGGWLPGDRSPRDPKAALDEYQALYATNQPRPEALTALIQQIRDWKASGIRVVAFVMPTTAELSALETKLTSWDLIGVLRQLSDAGADTRESSSSEYETFDGHHLSREGALAFTRDLSVFWESW